MDADGDACDGDWIPNMVAYNGLLTTTLVASVPERLARNRWRIVVTSTLLARLRLVAKMKTIYGCTMAATARIQVAFLV